MRSDGVVVVAPERQVTAGVFQGIEDLLVQKFVAQAAVKALDEGFLLRLALINVVPRDPVFVGTFQDGPTGEPCAVVADNAAELAVNPDQGIQFSGDPGPGQAGIGNQAQVLVAAFVDHSQHAGLA
jgi:hypothetical protein